MTRKTIALLIFLILAVFFLGAQAGKVEVAKDGNGYRLLVEGEPFEVKGVVWSYTPLGENYNYDLWSMPEDFIRSMIDTDAALMKKIGVNTIRVFSDVPPEWVEYFYLQHGIRTIINPLFGRYGYSVRGQWHPVTDYSDWYTRLAVQEEALEMVELYKDVPGVLMFLFGNENNYGLEWDEGGSIEDLPVGQQMELRAGYLYSLFEETISVAKTIDPDHPMGLVNGDLQYFNIIKELVPSMDILGINTYRGEKSFDLFFQSISELGVPFIYTELGADAWNAAEDREDQYHQALYLHSQWEEIYQNAYGKSGRSNCLGAAVFEWMDEWWKHGMELGLDIHETEGTWTNGGYKFDAVPGVNNMNEEWFGIIAQSELKDDGIHRRIPRAAYYMLGDIWSLSLYDSTEEEIIAHFGAIQPEQYLGLSEGHALRNRLAEQMVTVEDVKLITRMAGSFFLDEVFTGGEVIPENVPWETEEELDVTLGVNLKDIVDGFVRVKLRGETIDPVFFDPPETVDQIDLYQAELTYHHELFDLTGYYHSGHPDWAAEGDWFFLLPESYDFFFMDLDQSPAPYGVEFAGKDRLEGLKVYGGPEIYWDARPQVMAKYSYEVDEDDWVAGGTVIHAEEFGLREHDRSSEPTRRTSLYTYFSLWPYIDVEAGGLFSGMEKIGESYNYVRSAVGGAGVSYNADGSQTVNGSDWDIHYDGEIGIADTLSGKIQLTTDILRYTQVYLRYLYAGLVSESNNQVLRGGYFTSDSGTGNRQEVNLGARIIYGDFTVEPRVRWRKPLEGPIPPGLGLSRTPLNSPFSVFHNREILEGELVFTYDPEGATWFHEWNWQDWENASFAASTTFLYTAYAGMTDPTYYIDKESEAYFNPFSIGLPEQKGLWAWKAKVYWQPVSPFRMTGEIKMGHEGSFGESPRVVNYMGGVLQAQFKQWVLEASADWNSWGPEDWYRTFNITYPWQWKADLSYNFGEPSFVEPAGRIGLAVQAKTFDEFSDLNDRGTREGTLMEIGMYLNFSY